MPHRTPQPGLRSNGDLYFRTLKSFYIKIKLNLKPHQAKILLGVSGGTSIAEAGGLGYIRPLASRFLGTWLAVQEAQEEAVARYP